MFTIIFRDSGMAAYQKRFLAWTMLGCFLLGPLAACSKRSKEEEGRKRRPPSQVGLPYPADTTLRKPGDDPAGTIITDDEGNSLSTPKSSSQIVIDPIQDLAAVPWDAASTPWIDSADLPSEHWEIQYLGGRPIGYTRFRVTPSLTSEAAKLRCETTSVVRMRKDDQLIEQRLSVSTLERPNGELISFNVEQHTGPESSKLEGVVVGETLQLNRIQGSKRSGTRIPWKSSYRGPNALEQSLRRQPLLPGERRRFTYFDPILGSLADIVLEAKEQAMSAVLGGSEMNLLEIRSVVILDDRGMESRLWMDASGAIQKSYIPALDVRSFRSSESDALAVRDSAEWSVANWSAIPLNRAVENVDKISEIVFQVRLKDQTNPANLFPSTDYQTVRSVTALTCVVTVARPDWPSDGTPGESPAPDYLAPSEFVQLDDPQLRDLANAFATMGSPDEPLLERLCRGVHRSIRKSTFTRSFASAAEVAYDLQGDCTEHALFMAGIARIHGFPTRVACGLLVSSQDGSPTMVFHMWNEVFVQGKWIPIDATWDNIPAPANRIVITRSALSSSNPYGEFLPIFRAMGNLTIEVQDVRY